MSLTSNMCVVLNVLSETWKVFKNVLLQISTYLFILRLCRVAMRTVGGIFALIGSCSDTVKIGSAPSSGSIGCAQKLVVTGAIMAFVVSLS